MFDARALALAALLLVPACGRDVPEARKDAVLPPEAPAAALGTPAQASAPTTYTCAQGQTLQAAYPDPATAVVTYAGRSFTLGRVPEQSGARYLGQGREWFTPGSDGASDGTFRMELAERPLAGELIAECSTVGGVQRQP